jgi:hypothetical protein
MQLSNLNSVSKCNGLAVLSITRCRVPPVCSSPNETELSHRWRNRGLLRSSVWKSCESYSSERPAVGWSDWSGELARESPAAFDLLMPLTSN